MNSEYVLSKSLQEAIKVAEITKRPLLIKGEPGTGKTLLAHYYAKENNLPLYEWNVKSTTIAKDGLYFYDAQSLAPPLRDLNQKFQIIVQTR